MGRDDERIRTETNAAIREALEGDDEWQKEHDPGAGEGPKTYVSRAGMFRLTFNHFKIDRSDQFEQERWYAVVMNALNETLQRNDGKFRRRPATS